MAKFDGYINIDGTDLSAFGMNVTWNTGANTNDDTTYGDTTQSAEPALETASFAASFKQSFAADEVHDTLKDLRGTIVTVVWGPGGAKPSATSPHFSRSFAITEYNPGSGGPGDLIVATIAGTAAGEETEITS